MNTKLMIGAAAGLAIAAVAAGKAKRCGREPGRSKWDKMRERMEEMPADFPPRIMFDNIEATRVNTEQILALLEAEHADTATGLATT
jgi:hypothetical protein